VSGIFDPGVFAATVFDNGLHAFQDSAYQANAFQDVSGGGPSTQTGSLTLDAFIARWAKIDAVLKATRGGSFTVAAVIRLTRTGSFTADAVIMPRFTLDAIALRTMEATGVPVSISWDVWFSHSQVAVFKHEIILLRRDNLSGELLATSDPQGSSWDYGDNSSGYQWHAVGSFVDEAPTTGKYVLSVLKISGASDFYVGARTFSATGIDTDSFTSSTVTYVVYSGETLIPGCSVQVQSSRQAIRIRAALKAERTSSFSIAALLVPKKFLVDATIKATPAGSFTINSVFGQVFFVDAFIQPFFRVDAIKLRAETGSVSIDAVIRPRFSIDAFIHPYFRVDAVQKATETASFSIDAFHVPFFYIDAYIHPYFYINAEICLEFKLDAVILATVGPTQKALAYPGVSATYLGQTANILSPSVSVEAGKPAVVVVVNPPSDGGDLGIISSTGAIRYSIPTTPGEHFVFPIPGSYRVYSSKGNVYRPSLTGLGSYKDWNTSTLHFSIDAFISPTFTIDANFVWTFAFDFTLDAFKQIRVVSAFPVAAWIQPFFRIDARIVPRHFTVDAWIKCEIPIDAWIIRKVTGSFTVGAFISGYFSIRAIVTGSQAGTLHIASWITNPVYATFTVDAYIQPFFEIRAAKVITYYRHDDRGIKIDAWKNSGIASSFSINAVIKPYFRINAVIFKGSIPGSFEIFIDAYVSNIIPGSFSIDAFVQPSFGIDALVLSHGYGSTTLRAAIVRRPTGSFTISAGITGFLINAVIYAPDQQSRFTIFAIKGRRQGTGSFTISAEKYDASAYWDQYWEMWLHPHFYIDAVKATHPTGSFTIKAAIILPGQPITSWFIDAQITSVVRTSFDIEAFISSEHTVVYEGEGEVVRVLHQITERLDFPGRDGIALGTIYPNILFGPFDAVPNLPVVFYIYEMPVGPGRPENDFGLASTNENQWCAPYQSMTGGEWGTSLVPMDNGGWVFTAIPVYSEPKYVYLNNTGTFEPSMIGSAIWSRYRYDDVVISHPAPTIDAWIVGTMGEPITIDAEIVGREKQGAFTLAADVSAQGEKRGSWTLDASIRGREFSFFKIFATIVPQHFTMDAVVWQPCVTIDAYIQPFLTIDAFLVPVQFAGTGSFTIKAWKAYLTPMSQMHIDAEIVSIGDMRGGVSIDAVVSIERVSRFYLAAYICLPPAGFSLDAMVAPWFTVDAWIAPKGGGLGGFTIGAYVRGSSYIIFPGDGGAPTDPFGNPPMLTRKFAVKIEAGFAQPLPQADMDLVASILRQIAALQARLDALLCIPVDERIPAENAAIKDLREQIAWLQKELLVARYQDPSEFWMDATSKMRAYLDTYLAVKDPTDAQQAAYEIDLKTYNYDLMRLRMAREPQKTWVEITGDCIWSGTEFTQMARTGPGTFTITMKGAHNEFVGGEEIHFEIDGLRVFGGFVTDVERGYFFEAAVAPKTVLHGVDYNILFDRLVVRNWPWEFANHHKTGGDAGPYRNWPAFKKGTMDDDMIEYVFKTYLLPDLPMGFDYESGVFPVATPAPESPWVMPDPGSPLRVFMQSVSQITAGVWCIDPYMVLQYHDRATVTAPYPLTDGLGGISSRALSVTTDISQMMNDVLVWGTLGKTVEGEILVTHELGDGHWRERYWLAAVVAQQTYINNILAVPAAKRSVYQKTTLAAHQARIIIYKANLANARAHPEVASFDLYGRWQYAEFRQDIFHQKWLDIRARSILLRYDDPIMMATATVWDPGYQAGQVINVKSSVYGIDINLVIRQLHITFTVAKEPVGEKFYALPQYDLTMGLDPEAPWNIYDFLPYPGMSTPGLGMDVTGA
jgi:hypothetical protein